jgi:glycerol-3-phosphate dehydrogenase
MTRSALSALDGREFDVVVIGGGVNGASGAHHLAAAGYSVLIVDKGDFAAGSSSRSSRLLHCGLRFIEPGEGLGYRNPSMWDYFLKPRDTVRNLRRARDAMVGRSELAGTMPERVKAFTFCFPVYSDSVYRPWQVSVGMRLLAALGPGDIPLDHKKIPAKQALGMPMLKWLRAPEKLSAVFTFKEFRYEWPERIAMDAILDAQRMGAVARNHTPARKMERQADGRWRIELGDAFDGGAKASVLARSVLNTGGIWTDRINKLATDNARRKILGTKGAHIMFRLPPECADMGVIAHTKAREPHYVIPWRGMHYAGPTDTKYEGDIDNIHATEEEVEHLIEETNHMLPGLGLRRKDVFFSWAGVRPLTYDPDLPMGKRGHTLHDLKDDGMPGVFAMTSSPIQSHRFAGRLLAKAVGGYAQPSGTPQQIDYRAKPYPREGASPALLNHWDGARISDLHHAAKNEQPATLVDILFRRVGAGWTETMAREGARRAAEEVAPLLGWDSARVEKEVADYLDHIGRLHGVKADA